MGFSRHHVAVARVIDHRATQWTVAALVLTLAGGPFVRSGAARPVGVAQPSTVPSDPESAAITELLRQYRAAFAALDVSRVTVIWPSVDQKALSRAFGRLEQQFFTFDDCAISVQGSRGEARCSGNARVVPRVGGRSPQYRNGEWHFRLARTEGGWVIEAVEATSRPSRR